MGGGFTGVEVAGQFAYLINRDIKALYPEKKLHLQLLEAGPTLLRSLSQKAQTKITQYLTKQGIKIYPNSHIKEITSTQVILDTGETLPSDLTIWSAGVKNVGEQFLDPAHCEKGCIPVNEFLQSKNNSSLYAVGDIALSFNVGSDRPQPQLGEAAHKEGQYVARHILERLQNKPSKPFYFKSLGTLMSVGEWHGMFLIGSFALFGRVAWWIRRTTYLFFLPGVIRRLKIVIDWTLHGLGFHYTIAIERGNKK